MYAQVEQADNQDLFIYSVEKCYATKDSDPSDDADSDPEDVFFENQCPLDETMDFAMDPSGNSNHNKHIKNTFESQDKKLDKISQPDIIFWLQSRSEDWLC